MEPMLEEVIRRIPEWATAPHLHVARIPYGLTNMNYHVVLGSDAFVLRLSGSNTALLGIDRRAEVAATRAASAIGVAPEVVHVLWPEGHVVTRLIEGRSWSPDEFHQWHTLARLAHVLTQVHALPPIDATFSPFRAIEHYLMTVQRLGVPLPDDIGWLRARLGAVEAQEQVDPVEPCFCHNDLVPGNLLDDGNVRIVDWEYAGMGSRYFDLATVVVDNKLSPDETQALLESYFGIVTDEQVMRLARMQPVYLFREAAWALVQLAIAARDIDFDFGRYADRRFARLRQLLNDACLP